MPSFTSQVPNLRRTGPICQVRIGVSDAKADLLRQQNKPIPAPVEITALIDTGASGTAVKPEVIRQLQLTPRGVTNIATPSSTAHPCNVYDVSLTFPNGVGIPLITVIEVPLEGQVIQGLIGRDVLAHGILISTPAIPTPSACPSEQTIRSFPSGRADHDP